MKNLITILFLMLSTMAFTQPANDNCGGATSVTPDGSCQTGTNVDAVDNWTGEIGCATAGNEDRHLEVWYSFVATGTSVDIVVTDISIGNVLEVILVEPTTQPCTGPFNVFGTSCGMNTTTLNYGSLVVGNTYYYTISSRGNNTGSFEHCVTSGTPPPTDNQDCVDATPLCDNTSFGGNSSGNGNQELNGGNQGCLTTEHQSSWYTFTVQTSGNLNMTISPDNGTDDYDFALWGPNPNCPPTTTPTRCSFASASTTVWFTGSYDTGFGPIGNTAADGVGDDLDGWASTLGVIAGETYVLLVDNYSSSSQPFDLNWGGSAGLDCAVLPIELGVFRVRNVNGVNVVDWSTETEINNDYFTVERSGDGKFWGEVGIVKGGGNTNITSTYRLDDDTYDKGINYYRLVQTDFDGQTTRSKVISINNGPTDIYQDYKIINLLGQSVSTEYSGIRIIIFNDGSTMLVPRGMRNPKRLE